MTTREPTSWIPIQMLSMFSLTLTASQRGTHGAINAWQITSWLLRQFQFTCTSSGPLAKTSAPILHGKHSFSGHLSWLIESPSYFYIINQIVSVSFSQPFIFHLRPSQGESVSVCRLLPKRRGWRDAEWDIGLHIFSRSEVRTTAFNLYTKVWQLFFSGGRSVCLWKK